MGSGGRDGDGDGNGSGWGDSSTEEKRPGEWGWGWHFEVESGILKWDGCSYSVLRILQGTHPRRKARRFQHVKLERDGVDGSS